MILIIQIVISMVVVFGVGIILFSKDLIHALYALALILLGVAGIYVLLHADLVATVQLLIYAGGVVIFLVFGVMLAVNRKSTKPTSSSWNNGIGAVLSILLFTGLSILISQLEIPADRTQYDIKDISLAFFSDHLLAFELIGFILLVALVGASFLAKKSSHE